MSEARINSVEKIVQHIFLASIVSLIVILTFSILVWSTTGQPFNYVGLRIIVSTVDIPLILGMLFLEWNLYDFYVNLVIIFGESEYGEYFTVIGVIYVFLMNFLMFVEP